MGATPTSPNSGAKGALIVVDLLKGQARRVLDGDPSTQAERGVVVTADGQPLRRPDGRGVEFAADGIALSPDGRALYWQAVKGRTLYGIPTQALQNLWLPPQELARQVVRVGENGPADGLLIDRRGRMHISAVEENAVKLRVGAQVGTLVQDERLRWPDTFAEGPDGTVYVTSSHIMDMSWCKPENPPQLDAVVAHRGGPLTVWYPARAAAWDYAQGRRRIGETRHARTRT